jgi:hypothetical protein
VSTLQARASGEADGVRLRAQLSAEFDWLKQSIWKPKEFSTMLRLAIVDQDGKIVAPKDVLTANELLALVDQARTIIRDCERLTQQLKAKNAGSGPAHVPYLS